MVKRLYYTKVGRLGCIVLLGIEFAWLKAGDILDILKEKSKFMER